MTASTVSDYVSDSANKPIENAYVKFEVVERKQSENPIQEVIKTDKNGKFHAGLLHSPFNTDLKLTVSKQGYKIYESTFTAKDTAQMRGDYKIVLEKE